MMKKFRVMLAVGLALVVAGCSFPSVGPTEKGKMVSPSGYSQDILQTGKHFKWFWQDLIRLDTSTQIANERVEDVVMSDRLMMSFNVQFRTRIHGNDSVLNAMFSDIKPEKNEITLSQVYNTYGKRTIHQVARAVLSQYSVDDVLRNYESIGNELHQRVTETLAREGSPLEVSNVVLGKPEPPASVMAVIQATEERREQEALEQASQAIEVVKRQNAIVLAELDREKKVIEAETLRDQNLIVAEGLSDALLEFRRLETMEKLGDSGSTIFYPYSDAGNVGLQNRIFR